MESINLVSPELKTLGLSCRNCANLAYEYDPDEGGAGEWVCERFPERKSFESFPFEREMPCFELSFWFSPAEASLPLF